MPKYSIHVWKMILFVFKNGDCLSIQEIRERVHQHYSDENVNDVTIRLQTIFHSVNHPARKNDITKRSEKNPLFFYDGKDRFRLLSKKEKTMYKKSHKLI